MMHCRMCSQRLPRPGKLCRECERELDRARLAANTVAGLAPLGPAFAPPTIEELPGEGASGARFRLRAPLVAAAFALGLAGAAALYAGQRAGASGHDASVMLDRDVSHVTPRLFAPPQPPAAPAVAQVAAPEAKSAPARASAPRPAQVHVAAAPPAAQATEATDPRPLDRVLALSDALQRCASQTFFERLACEQRARMRYCDGAGSLPQCAQNAPRDTGG